MTPEQARHLLLWTAMDGVCWDNRRWLEDLDHDAFIVTDTHVEWDDDWNLPRLAAAIVGIVGRPVPLPWQHHDGGRADAGRRGTTGDCACRAITIATGVSYQDAYDLINRYAADERITKRRRVRSNARTGVHRDTMRRIMGDLGWEWTPTMRIGSGCTTHLAVGEVPMAGPVIANLSKHFAAIVDGIVYDNHDPRRDGTRCVYGYWTPGKDQP